MFNQINATIFLKDKHNVSQNVYSLRKRVRRGHVHTLDALGEKKGKKGGGGEINIKETRAP